MDRNNRYKQTAGLLATATALSLFSTSALSQDQAPGLYFGAFGGQSSYGISQDDLDEVFVFAFESAAGPVLDGDSSLDDKDTAFGIVGGYRFNEYFGVELGYVDLGSADYAGEVLVNLFGTPTLFEGGASIEASGPTAAIVASLPVSESFDLFAKAGMFFSDTEISVDVDGFGDSFSASSQDPLFGAGAAWNVNQSWSVRFEFQRYADVGDEDETGEGDIDVLSLGFLYRL